MHCERRRPGAVLILGLAVLLVAASGAAAQERWFHVRVSEAGADPVEVAVNLPLSLIESALSLIPEEVEEEIDMELNDVGFDLEELRQFWEDVRDLEDATFVTVESQDETVRVAKEGRFLVARTVERSDAGAEVDVRFPFEVLDALFAGTEEHRLDLVGAVRALAEYGAGDMVTVRDGETFVRVWVDDQNEPTI